MRVLLLSVKTQMSYGGIATWTEYFLKACASSSVDVDLVNTVMVGKRMEDASAPLNVSDEYKRTKRIFGDLKRFLRLHCNEYSAAHLNTSCGVLGVFRDYLAARKIKKNNLALITHYHCDIEDWIKNPVSKYFLKKMCHISDRNVVLCESSKRYLKNNFGVSCIMMPNFVNDSIIRDENKNIGDEIKKVMFVGRVSRIKGAWEVYKLAERFPDITFELIGKMDADMVKEPVPSNVRVPGEMRYEELVEYLDTADVFVLPSHSEGFSLALTEAMARGIPSIVTDVGASKDMLSDDCGIITAVGDIDELARALMSIEPKEIRQEMSRKSVEKVKNNYASGVVVKEIIEMYEQA